VARRIKKFCMLAATIACVGCACRQQEVYSLKDTPVAVSPKADKAGNCAGRHFDREAGRAPGGATTLEQKEADDRVCAELYRNSGYLKGQ
jgi:hypothetical protein